MFTSNKLDPKSPRKIYRIEADELALNDDIIFKNLKFEFNAGEWTCVMGVSGIGKTTLLKLIAGLLPGNKSNRIVGLRGDNFTGKIAYMAQNDLLLPWLNVIQNVLLGERLRRQDYSIDRAKSLLEKIGLGEKIKNNISTLSGGMRQRVSLARTMMENKPIILMDEPFSALDTINRIKIQEIAFEFLSQHTVVLVTHDPLEAFRVAHNIILISGKPAELKKTIRPSGHTLRRIQDPDLLREHAELLDNLKALPT